MKREVTFYQNTLAMARLAKEQLKKTSVAYKRPGDYLAEMLKSDAHLAKDKLSYEQKKITVVDERKESQAHREVAKEIEAEDQGAQSAEERHARCGEPWKKRKDRSSGVVGRRMRMESWIRS